jgi:hypothetical protein
MIFYAKLFLDNMPDIGGMKDTHLILRRWAFFYSLTQLLDLIFIESGLAAASGGIIKPRNAMTIIRMYPVLDNSPSIAKYMSDL